MTGPAAGDAVLRQVWFGPPGVALLNQTSDGHRLDRLLGGWLRLDGDREHRPKEALSYFRIDDLAAVMRRFGGTDPGRGSAHVLVGDADVLTAEIALATDGWPGWRPEPPRGEPPDVLVSDLPIPDPDRHREQADVHLSDVARVLVQWLDQADRPVSIVGCPSDDTLPLLIGLFEVGRTRRELEHVTWTFSTYETEHHDARGPVPEVVFLPRLKPHEMREVTRVTVDLGAGSRPEQERRQRRLVEDYEDVRGWRSSTSKEVHGDAPARGLPTAPEPTATEPPAERPRTDGDPDGIESGSAAGAVRSQDTEGDNAESSSTTVQDPPPDQDWTRTDRRPVDQTRQQRSRRDTAILLVACGTVLFLLGTVAGVVLTRSTIASIDARPVVGQLTTDVAPDSRWTFHLSTETTGTVTVLPSRCVIEPEKRQWSCELGRNADAGSTTDGLTLVAHHPDTTGGGQVGECRPEELRTEPAPGGICRVDLRNPR